nr:hypothetical protein [Tanacetum cinerariifolium]
MLDRDTFPSDNPQRNGGSHIFFSQVFSGKGCYGMGSGRRKNGVVLCLGSGRRKRKKGVGCGSGRQENYESLRRDCDEAFSLARAAKTCFANLDIWEFLRSNLSTLGEDFFKAHITEARFEIIAKEEKEHIVEKKIDVIIPLQGEFASPKAEGSLYANEDIDVVEVISAIDDVFDIESVKEVVVGGGEFDGRLDEINLNLSKELADNEGEFASPKAEGSLYANEDIDVVEVISAIDDIFDIGESNVESIEVRNEINLNLSKELADNEVSPIPTSLVDYESPRVVEGGRGKKVLVAVAEGRRTTEVEDETAVGLGYGIPESRYILDITFRTRTMDMTIDQQVALDEALVLHASILRIGKSNFRLRSDITSKEPTLQLVYDVLRPTPFYKAFLVIADVPEIYMQEFWATATVHYHLIRFKMDNKKRIVNLEYFREMLHICPRLPNQTFDELPFEEEILA